MSQKTTKLATIHNPTIQAVLSEMYRFKTREEALAQLEALKKHFTISRMQVENPLQPSVMLWVKGYYLSDAEMEQGYLGNFALVSVKPLGKKFTLTALRIETDLKLHPQRKRQQQRMPNWGHPILRSVKKGRVFDTHEEATRELELLHEEYATTSIPVPNKLYLMVYGKAGEKGGQVTKYTLEIKVKEGTNAYYIDYRENNPKPKTKTKPPLPATKKPEAPQGFFTARLALRKPRRGAPGSTGGQASGEAS